ncbi:MAG TPA: phytoene desaturase family protein [Flavobacteriales bacterium]|nr:phytoene desaturase family protein [Flavobacteriales bacterium]HNU55091.1 phytoene desaturase family protein [Flavobacteriales bacterium]
MKERVAVIGGGFSGLAAAAHLAKAGRSVTLVEKNDELGGRARVLREAGFLFDRGPSWYWMPDVFEEFFAHFGHHPSDLYELKRLDPSYSVYFGPRQRMDVPATMEGLHRLFEELEPGSSGKLDRFLLEASRKYELAMGGMVQQPGLSPLELIQPRALAGMLRMSVFGSFSAHVRKYFKHPKLISLLEFPVLFLGATPQDTPALFSLMNHADMALGTWYPMGGMGRVVDAMAQVAREQGVEIATGVTVKELAVEHGRVTRVLTDTVDIACDQVVAAADYHHVEQSLLGPGYRTYSASYWEDRTLAPSVLMFYIGVGRTLKNAQHHMLFFDEDLGPHAREIYKDPRWPSRPLFYASCTSVTDPGVAPAGMENLVILIPIAPGLDDEEAIREHYYHLVLERMERIIGEEIRPHVVHRSSCSVSDLIQDVNAFKGNAYGLANTLRQTAFLRPSIRSRKLKNLYFAGQFTVPGPGVPPALISGGIVARQLLKDHSR